MSIFITGNIEVSILLGVNAIIVFKNFKLKPKG